MAQQVKPFTAEEVQKLLKKAEVKGDLVAAWAQALNRGPYPRGVWLTQALLETLKRLGGEWPLIEGPMGGRMVNRLVVNGLEIGTLTTRYWGSLTVQVRLEFYDGEALEWTDGLWAKMEANRAGNG